MASIALKRPFLIGVGLYMYQNILQGSKHVILHKLYEASYFLFNG